MKVTCNICSAVLILLMISGCGRFDYDSYLTEQDRLIYENPKVALANLESLDVCSYSRPDEAYFNLLLTIARDKNYYVFSSDSLIMESCRWFAGTNDTANSSRAYLYLALVRYRINPTDSSVPELLLKAEDRLMAEADPDLKTIALIYAYLGRLNFENCHWTDAEHYYKAAAEKEETVGNYSNLVVNTLNLAIAYLGDEKLNDAEKCIRKSESLIAEGKGSEWTNLLNNARALYFSNSGKLDSALNACRLWTPSRAGDSDKYNLLASLFARTGEIDSAVYYRKAAIETRLPKDSLHYHLQHRALAELYTDNGMENEALEQYELAYESLLSSVEAKASDRIIELEKKYDLSRKEKEIADEHNKTVIIVILAVFLSVILFLLTLISRIRRRNAEEMLLLRSKMLDDEQRIAKIARATSSSISGFVPAFGRFANILLSVTKNEELFNEASSMMEAVRSRQVEEFARIINEDMDNITPSLRKAMSIFKSDSYKIMLYLIEKGYGNQEITGMTSQTVDGIRATKSQIKKALLKSDILSDDDRASLKLLSGD